MNVILAIPPAIGQSPFFSRRSIKPPANLDPSGH
jgi:hypothetical protein